MTIEMQAQQRADQGSCASRRLRRAGVVPGVVYGAGKAAVAISFDHNTLYYSLQKEGFHSRILSLVIDGVAEQVFVRDVQMHAFKPQVQHIDFQRVDANTVIEAKVPFKFVNGEISPAVKMNGKIIGHLLNAAVVRCLPANLPAAIEVDLSTLVAGESVHLSSIKLPEGVEFASLRSGKDLSVARA